MPVGTRGLGIGLRVGLHVGLAGGGGDIQGVTQDTTSMVYCPANAAEWALVMTAAGLSTGIPTCTWLMQSAGPSISDTIGSATLAFDLTTPVFQQAVAGWSRVGVGFIDAAPNQRIFNTTAAPNAGTTSTLIGGYWLFPSVAPVANRGIMAKKGGGAQNVVLDTTGKLRLVDGASALTANSVLGGAVRPLLFETDLTHSFSGLATDLEDFTGTFVTPASGIVAGFGGLSLGSSANSVCLYGFEFAGAAAELTKAQRRALLQTLGWTIPW